MLKNIEEKSVKHICHISTTFYRRSGFARRTALILKESNRQGYKVSLIVGRDNDLSGSILPEVDIFYVPELLKPVDLYSDLVAALKLTRIIRKIKPDIVHTHLAKGGILGRLAAKLAHTPVIAHTVHGPTFPKEISLPKKLLYRSLEIFCGRFTDRFIFVGEELKRTYVKSGITSPEKASIVYTGRPDIEVERRILSKEDKDSLRKELSGASKGKLLVITVGRIVPSKQIDHAIHIIGMLRSHSIDAHLAIVGKALLKQELQHEKDLRKLIVEQGLEPNITFSGYRSDVLDLMEASDALLLTSLYEGLPNVIVEALIAGTPIVTYPVSGVGELLKHGKNGLIVKQNDIKAASDALIRIYKQAANRGSEKKDKNKNELLQFRESFMIERKMQIYNQILQGTPTPAI